MTGDFAQGAYDLNGKRHVVSIYFPKGKPAWFIQRALNPKLPGETAKELTLKTWEKLTQREE